MPLAIDIYHELNRSNRGGVRIGLMDTDLEPSPEKFSDGPVHNNKTPPRSIVVGNSTDALEFLRRNIGRAWESWSLWWVMPSIDAPYYKISPFAPRGRHDRLDRHEAQLICAITPDGEHDARLDL